MEVSQGQIGALKTGELLNERYEVVRTLAMRGTGLTILALDVSLRREPVVIKLIHPHLLRTDSEIAKVQRAVLVARQLAHPNVVRTFDFDHTHSGMCFISMEYLEGNSLREALGRKEQKNLKLEIGAHLLLQAAAGLAHAHDRGVLHQDLKPENIILSRAGEVKIGDFGISRSLEAELGLTRTGEAVGTAWYMAPEHFRGGKSSPASDVYAYGVIAYEVLTGFVPFRAPSYVELAEQHLNAPLPPLRSLRSDAPEWLEKLTAECMAKDPEQRPQHAGEVFDRFMSDGGALIGTQANTHSVYFRDRSKKKTVVAVSFFLMACTAFLLLMLLIFLQTSERRMLSIYILKSERLLGTEFKTLKSWVHVFGKLDDRASLFKAVKTNDLATLEVLLMAGENVNVSDSEGKPLLHYAVEQSDPGALYMLLNYRPNLNRIDRNGDTVLMHAIRNKQYRQLTYLLFRQASTNTVSSDGDTPLLYLARENNTLFSKHLLDWKASPNVKDRQGNAPLHYAVRNRNLDLIAFLLKEHADPDIRDSEGRSPLHLAAGDQEMVAKLLMKKANPRALDNSGQAPILGAAGALAATSTDEVAP